MKGFKRVVSLLMALVMALSLTSAVWADNDENSGGDGGSTGTITLADELNITNADAKNYVNQYFAYQEFSDGNVLVIKDTNTDGGFYAKQKDKDTAEKAINACTNAIFAALKDANVQDGKNSKTTFGDRFNSFKEMLGAPLLYPEGGTGEVTKGDKTTFLVADGTYVTADDVTKAEEYLSKHFNLYFDEKTQKHGVNLKKTSIDDGTFMNSNAAQEAVNDYCNGDLRPRHHVALNQLKIEVSDATGEGEIYFWQLIDKYRQMLNDGNGDDDGGNGNGNNNQAPTGDKGIDELTGAAKAYTDQYISYSYNKQVNVTIVRFKNAEIDDNTGLYKDATAQQAAIAAYNAYLALGSDVKDALDELFVTDDNGNQCRFSARLENLFALAKNQTSGTPTGSISEANAELNKQFRDKDYQIPTLGVNFHLEFPSALILGTDYDYTYNYETGHLIITVKAPTEGAGERWLQAAAESYADGMVLCQFFCDNVKQKDGESSWNGNGSEGWAPYISGNITLDYNESSQSGSGIEMAVFNTVDDVRGVASVGDSGLYRLVTVWGNKNDTASDMDKYMMTFEVKTEQSFYYEVEGLTIIDKVDPERVHLTYENGAANCYTERRNELGVLTLQKNQGTNYNGGQIGDLTVDAPKAGYTLTQWEEGNSGNYGTGTSIPLDNRTSNFYQLTWSNGKDTIVEELTVYVAEMGLESLGNYGANGETLNNSLPVNKPSSNEVKSPDSKTMPVSYDASSGFFYTTFNSDEGLPTYEELNAGITLTPPTGVTGATHFRRINQDSNDMPGRSENDIQRIVAALSTSEEVFDLNDPDSAEQLFFPYVHTEYKNVGGVNVSYAGIQSYRFKIVQWLKQESNGSYTVLGYSYVSGRNDAFISKTVTQSVSTPAENDAPFILGTDMEFYCNRYPQKDGDENVQYFRFRVHGEGLPEGGKYKVYIPYDYFGMTKDEGLRRAARGEKPTIYHYYGNHELRDGAEGEFKGEYTEYGVYFEVTSFSPFVVDCSASSTGSHPYRVSGAAKAESPTTFDAGIALYGALAVSSLAGMGGVCSVKRMSKKNRKF